MMSKKINFAGLDEEDFYSASMFLLYNLNNIKEYSVISELPYILPKKDLLKFCTYFGGMTIKVPTVSEIYDTFKLILLYQYYEVENRTEEECGKLLEINKRTFNKLLKEVERIKPHLDSWNSELKRIYE